MKALATKDSGAAAAEVTKAVTTQCTSDKWSPEARTCIAKATTKETLHDCGYKQLTGEQADHLQHAVAPLAPGAAEALAKMEEFKNKMCACKDSKCAQVVSDEMTKWGQDMAEKQTEPPKLTEDDVKRAQDIGQQMGECMQKAMSASDPSPVGNGGAM